MGLDMTTYIGPYVRFEDKSLKVTPVESKPFRACPTHKKIQVDQNTKFCSKCGSKIEMVTTIEDQHVRVTDELLNVLGIGDDDFHDKYWDIQGHIEDYRPHMCLFILNDVKGLMHESVRGVGLISNIDIDTLNSMKDPNNKKFADFHRLTSALDQLGVKYESKIGYLQYWY